MLYSATIAYAIRALAHLATLEQGERILARDLAAVTDVPRQFLGKILHRLARARGKYKWRSASYGCLQRQRWCLAHRSRSQRQLHRPLRRLPAPLLLAQAPPLHL